MSNDNSLDLFTGKWKELDETVALQARAALQSIVDGLRPGEELRTNLRTTVIVHADNISRMSTGIEDKDDLRRKIDSCIEERIILPKWLEWVVNASSKFIGGAAKQFFGLDQ